MPTEYARCTWVPFGFFDRNPALDIPPGTHCHDEAASTASKQSHPLP